MTTSKTLAITGVAALALGGAFAAGVHVGGTDHHTPATRVVAPPAAGHRLASGDLSLVAAGDCDSLLGWYVDNSRDLVTAWGWGGGLVVDDMAMRGAKTDSQLPLAASAAGRESAASGIDSRSSSATGTNVQEAGVDEPDVVKTDGAVLLRMVGDDLVVYDVTGTRPARVGRLDLPGSQKAQPELLLVGHDAVVLSQRWDADGTPSTRVDTVDLSTPSAPKVTDSASYAANLLSARQYGDTVRLVLGTGLPMLDFVSPHGGLTEKKALEKNREVLARSTISDWLPSVTEGDRTTQVVDCADMARPEDFTGAGTVSVVGWSGATPEERSSTGVATGSDIVYSSADRLYLATSGSGRGCFDCVGPLVDRTVPGPWPGGGGEDGTTQIHAFRLHGTTASYLGSGEVEGRVDDRWAMDAVDGTLRVAVSPTQQTGDWNSIVTLQEGAGALEPLGRVDRLGVGEQIQSVRWFDDLAVLVTFRQVDPLYAIDLSHPAHPKALGALKVPGYSDYLHPIGDHRVLGLGVDADGRGMSRGGKVAVFDLSDPTHPVRQGQNTYARNIQVMAGQDPRQFTWVPASHTAYTVIARYGRTGGMTGWVSVLEVGADGSLRRHNVKGTEGYDDVAALRTVPLPDGRVALVTEDSARFL
ncbi:beta-propeller domain-containing protein [Nocardioides jiangxiensis]|uniref:Beta-propeller domain-containing protein n=1 Tax=Nocardioides jiangxiensis TaxID=3064524 RepID=A0ABT9AYP6_9ACTN|nr:beta-propeller domain-containing protein [Nocardioides sp. WY-20]MDO7867702.1 beta-propeller domain-containing protein [Nocardioides sp. WY-20]